MNVPNSNHKELSRQLEFVKQQEQLRAVGSNPTSKLISADSMIEDLLSKKETFQKRNPESQQKQELPPWLSRSVSPLYEKVWMGVQTPNGLADTPLLSSLLMSSGLSTDTLGYIWSLANRTVPGSLTQQELYLVLALVALAQTGYVVNNLAAIFQLPQAPIPSIDLGLLPSRVASPAAYPSPLSVTNLPEPLTFNWTSQTSSETVYQNSSDKIGISYVSSGPMVSPKLLSKQEPVFKSVTPHLPQVSSFNITEFETDDNVSNLRKNYVNVPVNTSFNSKTVTKHSNTFSFSFPTLNESPSHIASDKVEDEDLFDDEFTDFQSANSTSVLRKESSNSVAVVKANDDDDDEFSNFQKASPAVQDDLSVLVVGGKNTPSAQKLWVADSPPTHSNQNKLSTLEFGANDGNKDNSDLFSVNNNIPMFHSIKCNEEKTLSQTKYDVFQELDENSFSVFHNPLHDDEVKPNDHVVDNVVSDYAAPKSIFKHSLFENPDALGPIKSDHQASLFERPKPSDDYQKSIVDDDDEFSNFQNFPVNFTQPNSSATSENNNKYDIFRTIVFQDSSLQGTGEISSPNEAVKENTSQIQTFDCEMETLQNFDAFKESSEMNHNECFEPQGENIDVKFNDFHESVTTPPSENRTIDSLFSSLAISESTSTATSNDTRGPAGFSASEDKYKALRLLETSSGEPDEFGDFLGADIPSSGNPQQKDVEQASVQVRCLEACLNLLKDGFTTLSNTSTPEVISEVLNDPRGNTYLDCLLEVHRVSERILRHMDSDSVTQIRLELQQVWELLASYYSYTEHNHLTETVGAECGICRSNIGPSPVTFGGLSFHTPCANLYLHCVEPVLPNLATSAVQSH